MLTQVIQKSSPNSCKKVRRSELFSQKLNNIPSSNQLIKSYLFRAKYKNVQPSCISLRQNWTIFQVAISIYTLSTTCVLHFFQSTCVCRVIRSQFLHKSKPSDPHDESNSPFFYRSIFPPSNYTCEAVPNSKVQSDSVFRTVIRYGIRRVHRATAEAAVRINRIKRVKSDSSFKQLQPQRPVTTENSLCKRTVQSIFTLSESCKNSIN